MSDVQEQAEYILERWGKMFWWLNNYCDFHPDCPECARRALEPKKDQLYGKYL